jgi:GABA permease
MHYVSPDRVFSFIMNSAGAVALFVYVIIALSQLSLRSRMTDDEKAALGLKVWLHPWLGIVTVVGIGVIIFSMSLIESTRTQLWLSLISLAVLLVAYSITQRAHRRRACK